ncbi:hypothetical protein AB0I16_06560 [Streptomyces sp. NPDC050703]|uniref:hypothetical protein n=1 Tax=Streptomyces sp. NPDC050703 TaxID=3157218 RepID=UPI00341C3FF4
MNGAWRGAAWPGRRARAQREYYRACGRSLPEALWDRPAGEDITAWPGLPYALLYLEWEARYPEEWTRHAKDWGTKASLIRALAVPEHIASVEAALTDLVEIVVLRPYRCKDREYVRLCRVLDGDDLRGRLAAAARSEHAWARRHAAHVLWMLDHPEVPNTRHVWRSRLALAESHAGPAAETA